LDVGLNDGMVLSPFVAAPGIGAGYRVLPRKHAVA